MEVRVRQPWITIATFIALLAGLSQAAWALEYLSDEELSQHDGYTSKNMVYRLDDEGNTHFERADKEACHYYHSQEEQARGDCEVDQSGERERIAKQSFSRYLQQFANTTEVTNLDLLVDNSQVITLEILLDHFDYYHVIDEGRPDQAVVLFEGLYIGAKGGGPLIIESKQKVSRPLRDGERKAEVVIESEMKTGADIHTHAIRLGEDDLSADLAPSFGSLAIGLPEGMRNRIVIRQTQ